jgi:hypothetical protein
MPAVLLDEKVLRLAAAFDEIDLPHAFGGALALAYYATPRGTHDIDINFFIPADEARRVLELLQKIGVALDLESALSRTVRDGQIRVHWEHTPLDLFFSYDALHDSCMARRRRVPFGDEAEIAILSAEDLLIFKVIFDRQKDWNDLGEMVYALGPALGTDYIDEWLERILTPHDQRLQRARGVLHAEG